MLHDLVDVKRLSFPKRIFDKVNFEKKSNFIKAAHNNKCMKCNDLMIRCLATKQYKIPDFMMM